MMVIKGKKYRLKIFNFIIFIVLLIFIFYILGRLIFMLPLFNKTYNYFLKKGNYEIDEITTFKSSFLKCEIKEAYKIKVNDSFIKDALTNDLIKDGFKNKSNKLVRITKKIGTCKKYKLNYEKIHKNKYVIFNLNGKSDDKIEFGSAYNDEYVTSKVNNKEYKKVKVSSNLNINEVGVYIISYTININNNYSERLYRKVSVVDNEAPVILLNGDEEMEVDYAGIYKEPGFVAKDNYDGVITNKVKIKNEINTKKAGVYKITYKVSDSSNNVTIVKRKVIVKEKSNSVSSQNPKIEIKDGLTYINGILFVNKNYSLPKDYDPKVNEEALKALKLMQADAKAIGLNIPLISGYRSYDVQSTLYNNYVKKDGEKVANTYSAKPGYSEHQTGLAFDVGSVSRDFENTDEARWIEENCHLYGFIVRYPKGKTDITGYVYEPWHIRYINKEVAKEIKEKNLTLEEYLGIN